MVAPWIIISKDSLPKFLNSALAGSPAINQLVTTGVTMLDGPDGIIQAVIDDIRGAIGAANRCPISLTPNSIPPEARRHAMVLIIERLLGATPTISDFLGKDLIEKWCKDAEDWLAKVRDGSPVSTPIDPDPVNSPAGPKFGSISDFVDLGSDTVYNIVPTNQANPPVPVNLVALAGKGTIGLYWEIVTQAKYYNVFRGATSGSETKVGTSTNPWYVDPNLTAGSTYYYYVVAVSDNGASANSQEVSCAPM